MAKLESMTHELRYAARSFRRTPGPFWLAVAAMALGIGGATAVFSLVDRLLFRALPYPEEDRLVWLGMKAPINNNEFLLEADYVLKHQTEFESMSSLSRVGDCDLNEAEPLRLVCASVGAGLLPTLGLRPHIGRNIAPEEDVPNGPRSALLSYGFWQRRYGGDRGVLGRRIVIDGKPAEIAGVLPPQFELPSLARVDVLLPQQLNLAPKVMFSFLSVFARLKPGVTVEQARQALHPLFLDCLKNVPAGFSKDVTFHITRLRDRQVRDWRTASMVLLGGVLAVLLIACANVANLQLARAASRAREIAVRSALGASRGRLLGQMLAEGVLLGAAGGAAGLLVASGLLRVLVSLAPESIPRLQEAALDARVLAAALAAAVLSGIVFGLVPALGGPRAEALNTRTAGGGLRMRQGLVAAQIGLSFVLLSCAGLLLQSLWRMQSVPLGMRPEHLLTVSVQLGQQRYPDAARQGQFFDQALERLERLPGVRALSMSSSVPLHGPSAAMIYSMIEVEGRALDPLRRTGGMVVFRDVSPGYFAALGIPVVRGRGFRAEDRSAAGHAAVIGQSLARRLFPAEDPIGRRMRSGLTGPWRTIIGVAGDVKNAGLAGQDDPEYYFLWRQGADGGRRRGNFLLRSEADPGRLSELVRAEITQLDQTLPLTITTMEQNLGRHIARPRFESLLLVLFAVIGVALAAVGQFGVISYLVTLRSAEIGVRMALGATSGNVVAMVLRHTLAWTLLGAAVGLTAAWFANVQMEAMLFGVRARDAVNFAGVFALLIGVSLAAAWSPSRRASRLDPARVLRHE